MAAPIVKTQAATGTTAALPVSHKPDPTNISIAVVVSGTNTSKVQFTLDDPASASDAQGTGLAWFDHATLTAISANAVGNIAFPVRAVRLNMSAWTSGSATITVLQAGP